MATDKSLNIRQIKATEDTAAAIVDLRERFELNMIALLAMQESLVKIEADLAEVLASHQPSKFESASRSVVNRNK